MKTIKDLKVVDIKGNSRDIDSPAHPPVRAKKATWAFDGIAREFVVTSDDQLIVPFLSPTNEELIFFCKGFEEYVPPCNVIILNGDGSIRHKICPPKLISDAFVQFENKVGAKRASSDLTFIQPEIVSHKGVTIFTLWIGFSYDWYEVRALNLKTGEFGICLRSARQ